VQRESEPPWHHPLRSVAVALVFVALAFGLTLILQRVALRAYFILFVPAVMFSTWLGGRASGMVASALTVVAGAYLLPRTELADQLAWLIVAGIVTFGTSILTDARRRAEALLMAQAREESSRRRDAESLSQLKTDLLAEVAHELRQPLSAITAAMGLLQARDAGESSRQRAVGVIGRQANQLRLLIDDLLDLSRLARRELHLHKSRIDLCEIVDDSLTVIGADVAARRLDVSSSIPPCPLYVTADPTRVRQMLSNLLSNAVKFTPEGGRIDLTLEEADAHVVMRVRDNGRGISPDHLHVIFDMFQKGLGESVGLGIGLAVVKGLAEMHGGSVEARSEGPGFGSEFVVKLPVAPPAGRVTAAES
jgi:signal transduction histidine kinase